MQKGSLTSSFSYHHPEWTDHGGHSCGMVIEIGLFHMSYLVFDQSAREVLKFEMLRSAKQIDPELADVFIEYLSSKKLQYDSAALVLNTGLSTMVPVEYFNADAAKGILQTLFPEQGEIEVFSREIPEKGIVNISAIHRRLFASLQNHFNFNSVFHSHVSFLCSCKPEKDSSETERVKVFFYPHRFTMLVLRENQLQCIQDHEYESIEDVLYYLLQAVSVLQLNRETLDLIVSGSISRDSSLYTELIKYFRNISFEDPVSSMPVQEEQTVAPHFFTPSFHSLLCV